MTNEFGRRFKAYENEFKQSCAQLLGLATGLLADRQLLDSEIVFLNDWLLRHEELCSSWPGDVIRARVGSVLQDGHISEDERAHLVETLRELVGGRIESLAEAAHVSRLMFDQVSCIAFADSTFCLTGDFVYAPRAHCEQEIQRRGGKVGKNVTKSLHYLVVGGLGSIEWKHGSFGTKIEKAMSYKRTGAPILIVHEDVWTAHL